MNLVQNLKRSTWRTAVATATIGFLLTGGAARAADWPQFRGPLGNGVSEEAGVPANIELTKDLAWRADLPGRGLSSPIIIGDRVFVTCSSGPKQQRLHVICFSTKDGSKLWERQFWATGRTMCHPKSSIAAPTPASDGKRIVALFSSNDAMCLDLEGNLIWYRGIGRDYPNAGNSLGMSSSLVIAGKVAVAQVESESDGFTVALDLETGANQWKLARPHTSNWSSPVVVSEGGRDTIILLSSKSVTGVEAATGKVIWDSSDAGAEIPSATSSGGVLYVAARNGLVALQSGAPGEKPKQLWRSSELKAAYASPVVLGDKVFTVNNGGILACGEVSTGKRLWQLRLKGAFSATPLAAGNRLYCAAEAGTVQVVDLTKPEGEIVSELDLKETILATPAISGGALYLRSDSHLWRIGKTPTTPIPN